MPLGPAGSAQVTPRVMRSEASTPERAGLEPITGDEAKQYVRENVADRPWLNHAQYVGADMYRVPATVDKGGGHFLERHGCTITPGMTEAPAKRLEDPAITDEAARTPGIRPLQVRPAHVRRRRDTDP